MWGVGGLFLLCIASRKSVTEILRNVFLWE